jgi:hypothetical protein
MKLVFVGSLLSTQLYGVRVKTGRFGIRIMKHIFNLSDQWDDLSEIEQMSALDIRAM